MGKADETCELLEMCTSSTNKDYWIILCWASMATVQTVGPGKPVHCQYELAYTYTRQVSVMPHYFCLTRL